VWTLERRIAYDTNAGEQQMTNTKSTPIACALFNKARNGYVPAIHHPNRNVAHLQWARFPRKTKATAAEAVAYAEAVILYRRLMAPLAKTDLIAYVNAMAMCD